MKRLMKKEPTLMEQVIEIMSEELGFTVTPQQAAQRLCNDYLNATPKSKK